MKGTQPAEGMRPGSARPISARSVPSWPASGIPRGYDTLEFPLNDCARDFPQSAARRRRVRVVDEEQALLRRISAEFSANNSVHEDADEDAAADLPLGDGSSRLYRD